MKKLSVVLIAMMTLLSVSLAQADGCWHHHCDGDGDGGLLAVLVTLYTTSSIEVNSDDRAVYIQNVQEDAANFVAGGEETALLQEAINNLRSANSVVGSDKDIANALVGSTN